MFALSRYSSFPIYKTGIALFLLLSTSLSALPAFAQQADPAVPVITTATCGKPVCTWNAFTQSYTRSTGQPQTVMSAFTVLNPNTQYTLHIQNQSVSSAVISLNGVQVFSPSDFSENVAMLDRAVSLSTNNTLSVELRSQPGSGLTLTVIGVDNDPPSIAETANPVADSYGWNNTNVTINFACSDMTSGVAFCPGSTLLGAEGANQIVTGTAVDNAGNTATSSLAVNIDETPPTIVASASPAANAAGWNNTPVTVSFNCSDALSGVASCPSAITVSSEGASQNVSGTASDKAGNTASASASVSIDMTPPVVTLASPSNGATVTTGNLQLTGSVSDNLSGVANVTCNGKPATISSGLFSCNLTLVSGVNTIQVQAVDNAGNASSTQVSVTFGAPIVPPKALFLTPTNLNLLVGQGHNVQLVGDIGQIVPGASWQVSDPTVIGVSAGTPAQVMAVGQGTATITASYNGLSATMTVTVYMGTSLPPGLPIWSVAPLRGDNAARQMIVGNPINPGDPDLFIIEGGNTLRAFTADGEQLWATQVGTQLSTTSEDFPAFLPRQELWDSDFLSVNDQRNGQFIRKAVLHFNGKKNRGLFFPTQSSGGSAYLAKTVPDNSGGSINFWRLIIQTLMAFPIT